MEEEQQQRPDFSWRNWGPGMRLWLIFALHVVLMILLMSLAQSPSLSWMSGDASLGWPMWLMRLNHAWTLALLFGLPVLILGHMYPEEGLEFRQQAVRPPWKLLALATLIILVAQPADDWLYKLNVSLAGDYTPAEKEELSKVVTILEMPGWPELLINLLVLGLAPAIFEELFYRGTVQRLLLRWSGNVHLAVWLTAGMFALMHFNMRAFIPFCLLGVLLGYLCAWSGSVWLSIIVHFINNVIYILYYYWLKHDPAAEDFGFPLWTGPVSLAVTLGLVFLMYRLAGKRLEINH